MTEVGKIDMKLMAGIIVMIIGTVLLVSGSRVVSTLGCIVFFFAGCPTFIYLQFISSRKKFRKEQEALWSNQRK